MARLQTCLFSALSIAAAIGLAPVPARAAEPTPAACATMDAHLPAALTAWPRRTAVAAAANAAGIPQAPLAVGKPVGAQLRPAAEMTYLVAPERPGEPGTFGGMLDLTVLASGDYQVALGTDAWLDLVRDGALVASTAHAHGPDCSTIRKIVVFPLKPGHSVLEITGSGSPVVAVMVTRVAR